MRSKKLLDLIRVILAILAIPLLAMQFTDEVNWGVADFLIAGLLLFCLALSCYFAYSRIINKDKRIAAILLIAILFILIYIELAVGIFGTPFAGK